MVEELKIEQAEGEDGGFGPVKTSEVEVGEGELVVGTTVEVSDDVPRKVGFVLM